MPHLSATRLVHVVHRPLGTPDAIIVETSAGELVVVADPGVPAEKLEAVKLAALHLPDQEPVLPMAFVPVSG